MHLLVAINDNVAEWQDALAPSPERPRLPLPYAFGAAFRQRGHEISAVSPGGAAVPGSPTGPFKAIYATTEWLRALHAADLASFWGGDGIRGVMRQALLPPPRRRVVLNAYAWHGSGQQSRAGLAARLAGPFARAVVVMTGEQAQRARASLPARTPVIHFRCGIDTAFYRADARLPDVPAELRPVLARLLETPYVVMMGDQLRFEEDALSLVEHSSLTLVRVAQTRDAGRRAWLRAEISRRGIGDRFVVLERISYPLLRWLLRQARAYAGLVDSSWQPAGWTAACEALAAGVPVVAYEGLVTRELARLGAGSGIVQGVPSRDLGRARAALEGLVARADRDDGLAREAAATAAAVLDCESSAAAFVADIERLM